MSDNTEYLSVDSDMDIGLGDDIHDIPLQEVVERINRYLRDTAIHDYSDSDDDETSED